MRIERLEIRQVEVPYGREGYRPAWLPHVDQVLFPTTLVRLHADKGRSGVGTTNCFGREVVEFLRDHGHVVLGESLDDTDDVERLAGHLTGEALRDNDLSMLGITRSNALSGSNDRRIHWGGLLKELFRDPLGARLITQRDIPLEHRPWCLDVALWDVLAKTHETSVADLLGPVRDRIPIYASTGVRINDRIETFCERLRNEGISQVKLRTHAAGSELDHELERIERVIEASGNQMEVGVDANQAWTPLPPFWDRKTALTVAEELDRMGAAWLEEPLGGRDLEGIREIASAVELPVVGGELETGESHLQELMKTYDEINPDVAMATGFTLGKVVADHAEKTGTPWVPHTWDLGPGVAAGLQMACAIDDCPRLEYPWDPWWTPKDRDVLMAEPLEPVNGELVLPDRPGLGIKLDETALDQYTVDQWELTA